MRRFLLAVVLVLGLIAMGAPVAPTAGASHTTCYPSDLPGQCFVREMLCLLKYPKWHCFPI